MTTTITQTIRNYLEPYWTNDFNISDESLVKIIEKKIFKACGLDYKINKYIDVTENIYYVFSWIEDGKLKTFDLFIEINDDYYGEEEEDRL